MKSIYIDLGFMCGGLLTDDKDIITEVPPILKGWKGRPLNTFLDYYHERGNIKIVQIKEE